MKMHLLAVMGFMATVLAYADAYETYVDDARGVSIAHPSTWPRSVRGESLCFESPEGPTVSIRLQSMPAEDSNYTSIYQIPGALDEMLTAAKALPGISDITNGKTKLSSGDAYWIKYRMRYESLGTIAMIYTYQVVTLTPRGLLYCTYMASGQTDYDAQSIYDRVWPEASNIMRTLFVHKYP
jgi:hypothetical protein